MARRPRSCRTMSRSSCAATDKLARVAAAARACAHCADLPLGPRPVFRLSPTARVLIVGQAPGAKVHASGVPWDDRSGDRLRQWMQVDRDIFYDERRIAILPMGLCYPGRLKNGGDAPPRKECAPLWHARLLAFLPRVELTLLVGAYAQAHYLGTKQSMTETVRDFRRHLPRYLPLPHPSWRTTGWERRNPWFGAEVLPALRDGLRRLGLRP